MVKPRKKEPPLFKQIVHSNIEISPGIHMISFKRNFDFLPGQVVKIGINTEHAPRIYSICSGNHENEIRILFNIKEDGFLSPKLAATKPGDTILVSEPYGSFLGSKDSAWWIATGTGIAPFYSMFRSGMGAGKQLIHGVSFLNQFYFEKELESSFGENYVRCCSRQSSRNAFQGRVTTYLNQLENLPDVKYFLCGSPLMVVEVRDLLISKGISFDKILAEIYF